tara:strand:+ start:19121 stop:19987 length:867 start_codon:yes stop_codon:yes gene_type:complete
VTNATNKLADLLHTEQIDRLLFRGVTPTENQLPRVFGGQVLAQSLNSAIRTVPEDRFMHSLHAYFLRPGDISRPIIFEVDPIRDGGSFTTRRVVAKQDGKAIFNTSMSFKKREQGLEHQTDLNNIPAPDALEDDKTRVERFVRDNPDYKRPPIADAFQTFEFRTNGELPSLRKGSSEPTQGFWFKTKQSIDNSFPMHQAFLAYVSDFRLLSTAMMPHGLRFNNAKLQVASLDHSLWIHGEFDVNDWIYYHMEGPVSSSGCGLNFGRFYTQDGRLVASTSQEGLMRVRD